MTFMPGDAHYNFKHGQSTKDGQTGAYKSWLSMKHRCSPLSVKTHPEYAGRGIKVCDEWAQSFVEFFSYMGERPDGHSLDRIDPNGDYRPGNCRWATAKEQRRNQRSVGLKRNTCVLVNFFGEEMRAIDIASLYSIPITTLYRRIWQGYSNEELVCRESKLKKRVGEKCHTSKLSSDQVIEIKKRLESGERVSALARIFMVSQPTISGIKSGKSWAHIQLTGGQKDG